MKRLIALGILVLLTGCSSMSTVKMSFPDVPAELKESCTDLQQADANSTKLSDALKVVTANYGQYHECRIKVDTWIEWYTEQKKIFDSIK